MIAPPALANGDPRELTPLLGATGCSRRSGGCHHFS